MFTDIEIAAYHSIKAPDELRQKIVKPKKHSQKVVPFVSVAAACFVLIISGFVLNNQSSNIVINGQKLNSSIVFYDTASASGRNISSSLSVPVEIKISRSTKVSVSQGFISIDGSTPSKEIILTSSATVWWEIEPDETNKVFEMQISDKKGVKKVTLEYDNAKITATKGE